MKRLAPFIKPVRWAVVLAPLLMLIEVIADLQQPTYMADIVNVGLAQGDSHFVLITCLKMLGMALIGAVGGAGCTYFSTIAGFRFAEGLRNALYQKIQSFSFANIDRFKTGSLVTRTTNDVSQVQNALVACLRMLVRSPLLCIGGIIMAMRISMELAVVLFAAVPILAISIFLLIRYAFPLFRVVQGKLDRVNTIMQENLAGIRVIKAFDRDDYENDRFQAANNEMAQVNIKAGRIMAIAFPLLTLIMNVTMIVVYWLGSEIVWRGGMEVGGIMAYSNYVMQIMFSLMQSSFMLMQISRAKASVDRVNEVLDEPLDIKDAPGAPVHAVTQGRVSFENVSFRYPGQADRPVLSNISFTAEPGQTVAILGSTGSGKTSLVHLIPRLYDVTEGAVKVDGVDVREYALDALRSGIGVALQESILFSGSIAENLRWGDEAADMTVLTQATQAAQAHGFIEAIEEGYEAILGQRGVNLSGGQKQRLSIARALVKRPKILILDDATSAVDMTTEAHIQQALRERIGHCTVFIIAQRISSVMDADCILVLEDGQIVGRGTHESLIQTCDVYREIVHSQLGKEAVV